MPLRSATILLRTSSTFSPAALPKLFRPCSLSTAPNRSRFPTPPQRLIVQRNFSYSHIYSIEMASQQSASAWKPSKPRGAQRASDHKTGPKGEPMTPLPSATLIVLCPRSTKEANGQLQYDTLMVQRSARDGSSFRSAVVFPGGALDLVDEAEVEAALKTTTTTSSAGSKDKEMEKYMQSLKLCALRETFEETGLLLLPSSTPSPCGLPTSRAVGHQEAGMSAEEWAHARNDVHHNAVDFAPFLRKVSSKLELKGLLGSGDAALPDLAPMAHHSNWITPRSVVRPAKRFDAHFFITVLDTPDVFGSDKSLQISADGSETLSLRLQTPREIMYAGITDQISLFPPQFYILADLETALRAATKEGRIPIIPLIFDPAQATDRTTPEAEFRVTPVEEESRGLQGRNYSWDRKDNPSSNAPLTSWVSDTNPPLSKIRPLGNDPDSQYPAVTAVEPKLFPKLGAMLDIRKEIVENRDRVKEGADEEEDSFVFPLVLPGDWQASPAQKERARKGLLLPGTGEQAANGPPHGTASNAQGSASKPLNRLYVSPRSKEQGGGMTVRGAVRKGLAHLRDFQVGVLLAESPEIEERNAKL